MTAFWKMERGTFGLLWKGFSWLQFAYHLMQKKSKGMFSMPGKPPNPPELPSIVSKELWVRPSSNLRQRSRQAEEQNIKPASAQRFLELADVALGLKKPAPNRKKAKALTAYTHHQKIVQHKRKTTPPPLH